MEFKCDFKINIVAHASPFFLLSNEFFQTDVYRSIGGFSLSDILIYVGADLI